MLDMQSKQEDECVEEPCDENPNLEGDWLNIFLLTFLYLLQGIPVGLTLAIPFVLQSRGVTYADQAGFSFVSYPFCLKLLWAPVVDCVYSAKFGRRQTWLIPSLYSIGFILLIISLNMDYWLGDKFGAQKPKTYQIAISFCFCNFVAATQDIAVDGWSLTLLKRRNVGYVAACNNIGLASGQFFAHILFILLDSEDFCNRFRSTPKPYGFISFADFIFFWAVLFIVTTTIIWIYKKDNSLVIVADESELPLNVKESYQHLWKVLQIKPIQIVCLILVTCRIGCGPMQGVAPLKLIDVGIPTDQFTLLSAPLLPLQVILTFALSRYMTGPQSMHYFSIILICKTVIGILFSILLYYTSSFKLISEALPLWYYWILLFIYSLDLMTLFMMSVSVQAFYSRISDPRFGGMYLTLLNAVTNIGDRWPVSVALLLVDVLAWQSCSFDCVKHTITHQACQVVKSCHVTIDGFYIEILLSTIISVLWIQWSRKCLNQLQSLNQSSWIVKRKSHRTEASVLMGIISSD